ncbi:beta-lactamase/transpeptidase-like protein [Penicillium lagena]|uniref:beta-lactamase/transpeptidase-like protein n=1 Tax=Penicillium lagena TaxID=94218 RepID=UPI002541D315|nr:beta-lactamase/transpeptidase-like protein [Penicillium lagena]KAJ5605487.1 beta-lactamase/transpeptidase-like protein [Penicillium lagena]
MQKTFAVLSALLPFGLAASSKLNYCSLLGPVFPPPIHLSDSPYFTAATKDLSGILQDAIYGNSSLSPIFKPNQTSFTVQIFSSKDESPLFESYYTSQAVQAYKAGVKNIDENTVFRIGSASKLVTVLLLLIEKGESVFNEPIAKYVPEIREAIAAMRSNTTQQQDAIDFLRWEQVTIGELASQMSGVLRDYGFLDLALSIPNPASSGLPILPKSEIPPCGATIACNRTEFFHGLMAGHPVVPAGSTPIYSNAAYQILAYALETMTGQSYQSILSKDLLHPLGLEGFSYSAPNASEGIIPDPIYWALSAGDETPAGGLYSSVKDMSSIGRAILNNTLLPENIKRRWMKPDTHTSSLEFSVGAPWEIYSYMEDSRVIDLYTKAGDLGGYSSILALSPDHNVGFTILAAGVGTTEAVAGLSDLVANTLLPALEDVGKTEAKTNFGGVYESSQTNSTISISTDNGPGLKVDSWVRGGDNMLTVLSAIEESSVNSVRLYPTGLNAPGEMSFRAIIQDLSASQGVGPITRSCNSWELADGKVYGNIGIDEFVFTVDSCGKGTGLSPRAWRDYLIRMH